jgi:CDP-diglyceride synthetase
MRLPPQLRIAIGPSRTARAFVAALAVACAMVVAALPLPWWAVALVLAAVGGWSVVAWHTFGGRPRPSQPVEISLTADRLIVVRTASGSLQAGFVRDLTYVTASVTAIVWKPDGALRSRAILVLPDMLAADDFRRLRVLLRYGRREEPAGAPTSHA